MKYILKTEPRLSYIIVVWSPLLKAGPRLSYIIVVWSPLLKTGPRLSYIIVVWSPLLKTGPRVSDQMMNIQDWLPTLYSAAGFLFLFFFALD